MQKISIVNNWRKVKDHKGSKENASTYETKCVTSVEPQCKHLKHLLMQLQTASRTKEKEYQKPFGGNV